MKTYIKDIKKFITTWYYMLTVIVVTVLGYGYNLTNMTVSIDSLSGELYHGSGMRMLRAGRFGMSFWNGFLTNGNDLVTDSYFVGALSLVFFIWAAINFCVLFKRASKDTISMPAYTVFSACLISFPLMNEIWDYKGMPLIICGGYLFISFTLLLMEDMLENKKVKPLCAIAVCFFMTIVCASYESLVLVYIFLVFAILLFKEKNEHNLKKYFKQGLIYCSIIIISLILRLLIHRLTLLILGVEAVNNGATKIAWFGEQSIVSIMVDIIKGIFAGHFLSGLVYRPLGIYVICFMGLFIYMIYLLVKKQYFSAFLVFGMLLSTELLTLLQGSVMPLRCGQVFAILCSFVMMLLSNKLKQKNVVPIALCLVCVWQASYLNWTFTLNVQRYEEEKAVINKIGSEIERNFDMEKEIVFLGNVSGENYASQYKNVPKDSFGYIIMSKTTEAIAKLFGNDYSVDDIAYPNTNINSVLRWSRIAFDESMLVMDELFKYHGYDINCVKDKDIIDYYNDIYIKDVDMPCYPKEGYAAETEKYILVHLGEYGEK